MLHKISSVISAAFLPYKKNVPERNRAVEIRAMKVVKDYFEERGYDVEEQIIISIKEINLDQLKLLVRAYKTCPQGKSPHRLVTVD